ncbi:MAG TPA: peptidoglycan DD-metalloendopeptidase family protein [Candidatus Acidoferrales bacterium]|nr:peptidoglycan DD-metalloendopeptidase family protein [Candidatus Acidoferrales bacterium]
MKKQLRIAYALAISAALAGLGVTLHRRSQAERAFEREALYATQQARTAATQAVLYTSARVVAGANFNDSLRRMGVDPLSATSITSSIQSVFDVRRFHAGNSLDIGRTVNGVLRSVRYQIDADRILYVAPKNSGYEAEIRQIPSQTDTVTITGTVHESLWEAVTGAGESPELAMRLAEIFGWDLDFYTDTRQGDTFRIILEKKTYLTGKTAGYGRIFAAEYDNAGHPYQAVLFHDSTGAPAYYAADGSSLQKAFLRSPLKFAAPITSHFSQSRFHPILKTYRPHLGIDYAAPTGTPVQTIGNGRVIFAGYSGGAGNLVRIQHSNGFETMYMHLSRILVRAGQHVEQGERVGLVGMTGLATGPHLDFRILQNGQFRNFLTLHLPPAEPVARNAFAEFAAARDRWVPALATNATLAATAPAPSRSPAAPAKSLSPSGGGLP